MLSNSYEKPNKLNISKKNYAILEKAILCVRTVIYETFSYCNKAGTGLIS